MVQKQSDLQSESKSSVGDPETKSVPHDWNLVDVAKTSGLAVGGLAAGIALAKLGIGEGAFKLAETAIDTVGSRVGFTESMAARIAIKKDVVERLTSLSSYVEAPMNQRFVELHEKNSRILTVERILDSMDGKKTVNPPLSRVSAISDTLHTLSQTSAPSARDYFRISQNAGTLASANLDAITFDITSRSATPIETVYNGFAHQCVSEILFDAATSLRRSRHGASLTIPKDAADRFVSAINAEVAPRFAAALDWSRSPAPRPNDPVDRMMAQLRKNGQIIWYGPEQAQ